MTKGWGRVSCVKNNNHIDTGTYKDDAMLRQIAEAVQIENTATDTLMNDRAEWNLTRIPRSTIST